MLSVKRAFRLLLALGARALFLRSRAPKADKSSLQQAKGQIRMSQILRKCACPMRMCGTGYHAPRAAQHLSRVLRSECCPWSGHSTKFKPTLANFTGSKQNLRMRTRGSRTSLSKAMSPLKRASLSTSLACATTSGCSSRPSQRTALPAQTLLSWAPMLLLPPRTQQ